MPDLTDQILREITPDPNYHPLSPTVEDIEEYAEDLDYWGNQITIEWATRELGNHQTGWIRLGLLADRVRRYRLYKNHYPDWNTFCREVLGKANWQINKTIKAALAVMELIRWDFDVVPTCQSQAEKLLDCWKKRGGLLIDLWQEVVDRLPERWMLTANGIAESLGFAVENNNIPKQYRDRLAELARRDGMTITEKMDELIAQDEESTPNDPELDELPGQLKLWHQEMLEDVAKHDNQIWLLAAIAKLVNSAPKISQFNWLRAARCQI